MQRGMIGSSTLGTAVTSHRLATVPYRHVKVATRGQPMCSASRDENSSDVSKRTVDDVVETGRRRALMMMVGSSASLGWMMDAVADEEDAPKVLCSESCVSDLAGVEKVTLPSGLAYQDIVVGNGPTPPVGYQIVVNYILMTPEGRVISNSLENGNPYDIRVGTGQVVAGLDEGLKTMRVGGVRRVYVPGDLSFPKGLPAGPGRPRVPPASPVVFDVQLLYIPGLDMDE
jgi:peptidylprolyl isomerase